MLVQKGQVIVKIGNFLKSRAGGTTTHLLLEIRRGDNFGYPLATFWTLVRAYERLIGEKGVEITGGRNAAGKRER